MFQDITTLLLDPVAYKDCCSLLEERYRGFGLDAIAGFEARGFFFGPPLALALGLPFVPLRKPKKLPGATHPGALHLASALITPLRSVLAAGPTISESYALEYGTDALEMHVGAVAPGQRVLLVDDLVATGGTLAAGAALVRRAGGVPVEACCIIELPELGVRCARCCACFRPAERAPRGLRLTRRVRVPAGAQAAGRPAVLHAHRGAWHHPSVQAPRLTRQSRRLRALEPIFRTERGAGVCSARQ